MNIHREKVKMTNKVLSISIAAYNVENCIKETLMSLVVKNNLEKLEILIIDDGSTDGTAKAAQEFVKKYPCSFFYFINKMQVMDLPLILLSQKQPENILRY